MFLSLMSRSKVFVCTSYWEGLGLPNIEAYLLGCSVVSTKIPSAEILFNLDGEVFLLGEDSKDDISDVFSVLENRSWVSNSDELESRSCSVNRCRLMWVKYLKKIFSPNN